MGGEHLLRLLIYLIRAIANRWCAFKGRDWPVIPGKVAAARFERSSYGCDYLHLNYEYEFNSQTYEGSIDIPYVSTRLTEDEANQYIGTTVQVGMDPLDASNSFPVGL